MIDLKISPRQSGKTRELINLFQENPGIMIVKDFRTQRNLEYLYDFLRCGRYNAFENTTWRVYDPWIYMDDFFFQDVFSIYDVVALDNKGKNIVIRTSENSRFNGETLLNYAKEKYPEYYI